MCGRFVASRPISDIVDVFDVDDVEVPAELAQPRWNIAPQAGVLAVTVRRPKTTSALEGDRQDDSGPEDGDGHRRPRRPAVIGPQEQDDDDATPDGRRIGVTATRPHDDAATPNRRRLTSYQWGLVPSWAKDPGFGARAFNARAESLPDKSAFRNAVARRRCLIPADAFYEWEKAAAGAPGQTKGPRRRKPWCYRAPGGGPLAFAGLWEAWKVPPKARATPDGSIGRPGSDEDDPAAGGWHDDWLLSCTIITTPANETVSPVHDRMPLVLDRGDWEAWLHPGPLGADELAALLRTPPVGLLEAYEVSSEVNTSSAEGPQLVEPLAESAGDTGAAESEPTLF